ncbi:major facilitator superfamily transporter [Phlyctema vagabunda]|uniref:Major facilitator superfamily transporter n=1 Tax=Phlyctema vagabunda TaxID=108571 RepID=A0ABR4PTW2_9HELO
MSENPKYPSEVSKNEKDLEKIRELILLRSAKDEPKSTGHAITSFFRRERTKKNPDEIATQPSVFDDEIQAQYFQPSPQYENLHRFDLSERWTWKEEKELVRRIDWKVTVWACIAFFALDLDRSNLSQANTDNFLEDMNLNTNGKYEWSGWTRPMGMESPSPETDKKQSLTYADTGTNDIVEALLGLLQGGFIPDVILNLSYFFKGTELPFRLALFWMANRLTDVVAPLLAYGLLRLRGVRGHEGWRWLFLIEGILTLSIGIWSVFMMTPSPTQTKAWWRPEGWFTDREEKILVNRILRDDPSKGDMHNRQAITLQMLWRSLCDYSLWPIYVLGLTFGIPAGPPDQYLTLTLRQLGFNTFDSNLLSIPAQIATTINMLLLTYLSELMNQRALLGLFAQIWFLPCVVALAILPAETSKWGSYALVTVLLSYPSPHPMQVGWSSRNSNTVRTRTVSAAVYNICVQLQAIISSNIYRADDKPHYRRGNRVLIGIASMNIVLYLAVKGYYLYENKRSDKIWDKMTSEEQNEYRENTKDEGSKRIDFRFAS